MGPLKSRTAPSPETELPALSRRFLSLRVPFLQRRRRRHLQCWCPDCHEQHLLRQRNRLPASCCYVFLFRKWPWRAIYGSGRLTVANSTFSNNFTVAGDGRAGGGGAIYSSGTLTVTNSTFSANSIGNGFSETAGGGAIFGSGTIMNSTFSGNSVFRGGNGGAIAGGGTIINSTFVDNFAVNSVTACGGLCGHGGAIAGGGKIINSTFVGNGTFGARDAGAIDGSATLKNTIVAGSTDGNGGSSDNCFGTITDAGYNISDDNSCDFSTTSTGSLNNTKSGAFLGRPDEQRGANTDDSAGTWESGYRRDTSRRLYRSKWQPA